MSIYSDVFFEFFSGKYGPALDISIFKVMFWHAPLPLHITSLNVRNFVLYTISIRPNVLFTSKTE